MSTVKKAQFNTGMRVSALGNMHSKSRYQADISQSGLILNAIVTFIDLIKAAGFKTADFQRHSTDYPIHVPASDGFGSSVSLSQKTRGLLYPRETISFPDSEVTRGELKLTLSEYVKLYQWFIDEFSNTTSQIEYDVLRDIEESAAKGHTLVFHGMIKGSGFMERATLGFNVVNKGLTAVVSDAFYKMLTKTGYIQDLTLTASNLDKFTLPKGRNTGTWPNSKGIEQARNTFATAIAIITGDKLLRGDISLKQLDDIWNTYGSHDWHWSSVLNGQRMSRTSKFTPVYLTGSSGCVLLGVVKGISPRPRIISMANSILKSANRLGAKAVSTGLYSLPFFPRTPEEMWKGI